jgi:hypothetical protein
MNILAWGHIPEPALAEMSDDPAARQQLSASERRHLDGCDRCLGLLEGHRRVSQLFAAPWQFVTAVEPTNDFGVQRVRGVVSAGGGVGPIRLSRPIWIVAALVLLSALVGTGMLVGAFRRLDGPPAAVDARPTEAASPSPSTLPSPKPSPSRVPTSTWSAFTSLRHGLEISHPTGWIERAGRRPWNLAINQEPRVWNLGVTDFSEGFLQSADHFMASDLSAMFAAYGMALPIGKTYEGFIEAYQAPRIATSGVGCYPPPTEWERITIDGHEAGLVSGCGYTDAMVQAGGRVYIFSGYGDLATNRLLFEAFLSTVRLDPAAANDTPVNASPSPG